MKKSFFSLFILLSITLPVKSQTGKFAFKLLPSQITFLPLRANFEEARIGIYYFTKDANLKVDLGGGIDVMEFTFSHNDRLTIGIEFMAYALSTSTEKSRLQIDAADGFFGGHASFAKKLTNGKFSSRLRFIHNSAHFVDGHYDFDTMKWKNNVEPIPFTRDFAELTLSRDFGSGIFNIRYYGGISYSVLVRPSELKRTAFSAGIELNSSKIIGKAIDQFTNVFIAYHFTYKGTPFYSGNNHIMLGIKLGNWERRGLTFYASYFSGKNMFSEYYKNSIQRFGLGFFADIF